MSDEIMTLDRLFKMWIEEIKKLTPEEKAEWREALNKALLPGKAR